MFILTGRHQGKHIEKKPQMSTSGRVPPCLFWICSTGLLYDLHTGATSYRSCSVLCEKKSAGELAIRRCSDNAESLCEKGYCQPLLPRQGVYCSFVSHWRHIYGPLTKSLFGNFYHSSSDPFQSIAFVSSPNYYESDTVWYVMSS